MVASILILAIAAWLQLSSVATRSEFVLPSAANAIALQRTPEAAAANSTTRVPSGDKPVLGTVNNSVAPQPSEAGNAALPTNVAAAVVSQADQPATVADSAAIPPKYGDLAMPPKNNSTSAKPITPAIEPQRITKIVVSEQPGTETDAKFTQTLVDALGLCQELDVNTIEIRRRVVESLPIKITRDKLDIFSSLNGGSEVRFKAAEAPLMQREAMIELGMHRSSCVICTSLGMLATQRLKADR